MIQTEKMWKSLNDTDAFAREDEKDNAAFYATDRLVHHLDTVALSTVERLIGTLVIEEESHPHETRSDPDALEGRSARKEEKSENDASLPLLPGSHEEVGGSPNPLYRVGLRVHVRLLQ